MNNLYAKRRALSRSYEIFSEPHPKTNKMQLKCWITGVPVDGRLVAKARFQIKEPSFTDYQGLVFEEGEAIILISASVENTYRLFGFKETTLTL
jgi:hypothetical protein